MKRLITMAILAALLLTGCSQTPDPQGTAPSLVQPESDQPELLQVSVGTFYNYYTLSATVIPYTQGLSFDISGSVSKVYVYPGKEVEAGELLAELDHSSLTSRIASLEADLDDTKAAAAYTDRMAKLQIEILKVELLQLEDRLAAAGEADVSYLRQQVALKKNDIAQAEADLRHEQELREARMAPKQEELEQLQEKLKLYFLYAPFSGRIAYDISLAVGQYVSQSTPVIALSDDSHMVLDPLGSFWIETEENASSINVRIGDTDYAIERIPSTEQEILYAAQNNSSPNVLFDIVGTEEDLAKLELGQYANIGIISFYQENAIMVPIYAVSKTSAGLYSVDVDENGQRVERIVEIGAANDVFAWISNGLEEGEYIYVG